jgi:hypothetical protein
MDNKQDLSGKKKDAASFYPAAHNPAGNKTGTWLSDNRPKDCTQCVMQMKTYGQNLGQPFTYNGSQVTVGKKMWVKLDPKDKLQGQSANMNKSQDDLMEAIRDEYNLKGNEVVKGHLLNDNLGGTALDANLFPITGEANKLHLHNVESVAKEVYEHGVGLYYTVEVESDAKLKKPSSKFKVQLAHWDPAKDVIGDYMTTDMNVSSYLHRAKRKRAEVRGLTLDKHSKQYQKLKKVIMKNKRHKLRVPMKKVSELSKKAKAMRDKQPVNFNIEPY